MENSQKSPYKGLWIFIIMMILPSVALTFVLFAAINLFQARFGFDLNFATAKALGCGMGTLYHICCWLYGAFKEDFEAVKIRWKEFFFNLGISPRLAFKWYFEDLKVLGAAFWIDLAIVLGNLYICVDAVFDYIALRGF